MIWLAALALAAQDTQLVECGVLPEQDDSTYRLSIQCEGDSEDSEALERQLSELAAQVGPVTQPVHSADRGFQVRYDPGEQSWVVPNIWLQFGPPSPPSSAMRRMSSARCGVAGIVTTNGSLSDLQVECEAARNRVASDFEGAIRHAARNWRLLPVNEGSCFAFPMDYRFSDEALDAVPPERLCDAIVGTQ